MITDESSMYRDELAAGFTASLPELVYELRTSMQTIELLRNILDDLTAAPAAKRQATETLCHALQALGVKLMLLEERLLEAESLRTLRSASDE